MFTCAQWGAVGEFAASRHGAVTRTQAAGMGISTKVVKRLKESGHLDEPLPGVLVVSGSVPTWEQRLIVATMASSGAGRAGYRSAAALHVLDGYGPGPVEVMVPTWRQQLCGYAVQHVGTVQPRDTAVVRGVPCTSVARTLADLGSVDTIERVRTAFECAWRRGASLADLRSCAERLHRPGQRGTGVLLQLLDEAQGQRRPTESALELRLESCLRGIDGVVRQHTIRTDGGAFVARVDFAIPRFKIALEAHSREFHFGVRAAHRDETREHEMNRHGWIALYFGSQNLRSPARVRQNVLDVIRARQ